jgi:hypothetical protein
MTTFSLGQQFHRQAIAIGVVRFLDAFDGARLLTSSRILREIIMTNDNVWELWRQAFPLSLLERYGRGNDQARRRTLWTKWANTSQLLNRHCYYASLTLNTNVTFFTLTREMLGCECELISQSARSLSLARQAAAVRKFEQWTLMLADKAAAITELRRRNHEQLERRVRQLHEASQSREDIRVTGREGFFSSNSNGLELYSEIFKQVQLAIAKVARFDTAVLQQEHDSELSLDCDQSHEQMPIQHPLAVALAKVRTTRRSSGQLLLSSFEAFDSNKTTSVGVRHFHEVLSAAHVKS